ncbi:MAG TPA: DUF6767 domain-containing protein [Kineosporiaceae bacterium]|nr:DUF6767 domain-containing protein [Kineosporiaceae bacterium]
MLTRGRVAVAGGAGGTFGGPEVLCRAEDGGVAEVRGGQHRWVADARCPLRPGEPCTLCHPEAHGPGDCPTVALVMDDPQLRAELVLRRDRARRSG